MVQFFLYLFIVMVTNDAKKMVVTNFPSKWGALNANAFTVELMWLLESTIGGYTW